MTKIKKQNLLLALTATFALAACATIATLGDNQNKAAADSVTVTPDETAKATDFYMEDGAAVRVVGDDVNGIRFTSTITESYWNSLQTTYGADATYKFYSVVTDGTTGVQKDFGTTTPTFTNGVHDFYAAITYNVSDWTDEKKAEAYALELQANTYVDVTKNGETTPTTIAAAGATGVRSMRVVADDTWLTEGQDEALEAYFTVGNRSEETWGGFDSTGAGVVNMPALSDSVTEVSAYFGAEKLTATVSEGVVSFSGVNVADMTVGTETYLSVFAEDKVYSCKVAYATALLTADNITTLQTATDGYYVLGGDIDMSGITNYAANSSYTFSGTLNGAGFEISNFKPTATGGLVYTLNNATIKNLSMNDVTLNVSNTTAIAYQTAANTANKIENVIINVGTLDAKDKRIGGVIRNANSNGQLHMTNVIINMPTTTSTTCGLISSWTMQAPVLKDCYFIGGNGNLTANDGAPSASSVYTIYADVKAYVNALNASENALTLPTDLLKEYSKANIESQITVLTEANFAVLATATSGYYMLTGNVDMANVSSYSPSETFTGTLDGNGYTISNVSAAGSNGGIFKNLNGATIKNLAIINAKATNDQCGILAYQVQTNAITIENVFISGAVKDGSTSYSGAIVCKANSGSFVLNNVIIELDDMTNTGSGFISGFTARSMTLTNCYFIGGNGQVSGYRSSYVPVVNGTQLAQDTLVYTSTEKNVNVYTKTDSTTAIDAFNTAYSGLTLTTELQAWCEAYLGSTPTQGSIE